MTLPRPIRIALGAASIWPIVYMFVFVVIAVGVLVAVGGGGGQGPSSLREWVGLLHTLHAITMFLILALMTFYIIHVFRNPALRENLRLLWVLVLLLGNIVAMPIYWYLFVWKDPPVAAAAIRRPPRVIQGARPR